GRTLCSPSSNARSSWAARHKPRALATLVAKARLESRVNRDSDSMPVPVSTRRAGRPRRPIATGQHRSALARRASLTHMAIMPRKIPAHSLTASRIRTVHQGCRDLHGHAITLCFSIGDIESVRYLHIITWNSHTETWRLAFWPRPALSGALVCN